MRNSQGREKHELTGAVAPTPTFRREGEKEDGGGHNAAVYYAAAISIV